MRCSRFNAVYRGEARSLLNNGRLNDRLSRRSIYTDYKLCRELNFTTFDSDLESDPRYIYTDIGKKRIRGKGKRTKTKRGAGEKKEDIHLFYYF